MNEENRKKLRTLCFLVKKDEDGKVSEVCLGMKKTRFGKGKWAGIGGKVEKGEAINEAAAREVREEVKVDVENMQKVAETDFRHPHKEEGWSQLVHVFMTESWNGDVGESEEMKPRWFKADEVPYDQMWEDAQHWLPQVLEGQKINALFTYGENDKISEKTVNKVSELDTKE